MGVSGNIHSITAHMHIYVTHEVIHCSSICRSKMGNNLNVFEEWTVWLNYGTFPEWNSCSKECSKVFLTEKICKIFCLHVHIEHLRMTSSNYIREWKLRSWRSEAGGRLVGYTQNRDAPGSRWFRKIPIQTWYWLPRDYLHYTSHSLQQVFIEPLLCARYYFRG